MTSNKDIENIIDSYNNSVQNVINKFFKTPQDIDDIKQEVFIKTWKNLPKFRNDSNFWSWMRVITVNTCKDHLRKQRKHKENVLCDEDALINFSDNTISHESKVASSERQKFILSKIQKLKPKLREVIILYDIEELTYEEISRKVNCPIGTVKSRLFNARKELAKELKELL